MTREGILLALRPQLVDLARKALAPLGMPLTFTYTLAEARRLLEVHSFRLAIGTLQFDDSRLFDLLLATRAASTPLVALRLTPSQLPESVIDAFFRAAELSGFGGWIDVYRLTQQVGEAEAVARMLTLVRETALPAGVP